MGQAAESSPRRHERHGNMLDLLITNIKMERMDRVALAARSVAEIGCRSWPPADGGSPPASPGIFGAIESLPPTVSS
jgi:hypothetical protein